jgi:hypothetical protein
MVSPTEWCTAVGSVDIVEGPGEESARTMFGCTGAGRHDRCRDVGRGYPGGFACHRCECCRKSGSRVDCEVIERGSQAVELTLLEGSVYDTIMPSACVFPS